ncbi:Bifunctional ligase/repressor BirA [Vibrio stylophorae]|uniref:Bifunctional ligase/repressor BirA n=1 Tax=Vibrio stylophorae TaxID=659351 RepID=A0ABN8DMM5_9VIBR|nr:bifunctional biotin--[acetyl-CoA-carboxylase] ligase/biotin operon repressor BirA [Vibrio stylophorae]CAH0532359.1 Bifunctional ligase/repressor BirA [Vibrio stylophorae]
MVEHGPRLTLIRQLADGQFHSGQALGELLGMSRAAIAKHIQVLQQWGLDIYRVQGKGYCLSQPLDLLDESQLKQLAPSLPAILVKPVIDSTNQYLLDRVGELSSGAVCLAEYQVAGRGRRGRQWISPFGSNLYCSMYWRLDAGMAAAMGLSLVVGVALAEWCEAFGGDGVKVKWPNDLYYQDQKLAGILVEMTGQAGEAAHLVIGMGINLAMPAQAAEGVTQPWTNLQQACGVLPARNELVADLLNRLQQTLLQYEAQGLAGFVERWNRLDNFLNRPVKLLIGPNEVRGIARGINHQGALMLETETGIHPYLGGEISLRSDA